MTEKGLNATILKAPSPISALIFHTVHNDKCYVVKDYRPTHRVFRATIGRFLIYREAKALMRLSPLRQVPKLIAWVGNHTLVTTYVKGKPLELFRGERPGLKFFERLELLIHQFHGLGVVHCDLTRAANILVGEEDTPYIVDWASAIFEEEFRGPLRPIYEAFRYHDQLAVIKYKLRYYPEALTLKETQMYTNRGSGEILVRRIRDKARELLKRGFS